MISNRGFTLIETMLAVLLLSVAIAGPLTIASKGLTSSLTAKDKIGANYLAQDAIEYVRFARDTNTLSGGDWLTGSAVNLSSCENTNGCYLDSTSNNPATPTACSSPACPTLNYDTANHYYTYAAAGGTVVPSPERYLRTIKITPVGATNSEATLTVTVQWTDAANISRSVIYREELFAWQ